MLHNTLYNTVSSGEIFCIILSEAKQWQPMEAQGSSVHQFQPHDMVLISCLVYMSCNDHIMGTENNMMYSTCTGIYVTSSFHWPQCLASIFTLSVTLNIHCM